MNDRICARCKELFGHGKRCQECGVGRDRQIRKRYKRGKRTIGGKRGRNSGQVSQHGKKK